MPKTLLLADDSITIQKVVAITFASEDIRVVSVDNGEDALAKARELKPDVILADVVMPRKNGYELCEAVKSDAGLRSTPVLLLAGTFEAFDEARARQAKADGHIAKPFESGALINRVKELVGLAAPGAAAGALPSTSSRTLLMSAWLSNGFARWPSACAPRARFSSKASNVPERSRTGMCFSDGSPFTASHTSYPLRRGITTSARITSGRSSRAFAIASSPLSTAVTL